MRALLLLFVFLMSFSAMATQLPSIPNFEYSEVNIYKIQGIRIHSEYTPASQYSVPIYKVALKIAVIAEGNVCGPFQKSLGIIETRTRLGTELFLLSGKPRTAPDGCLAVSYHSPVNIIRTFQIPVLANNRVEKKFIITVKDQENQNRPTRVLVWAKECPKTNKMVVSLHAIPSHIR